tara:strand:+ start:105 stop:254 length:150 start_codon:yes stop_codon:yes gene_type:complete
MTAKEVKGMEPAFTAGLINALREQIRNKDERIEFLQSELAYLMRAGSDE